ncbi:HNH endonuclease [Aeromonas caviae]|uniref:HNH endonuclease n=1 Tax=Aeromonas caviae TaxID=648 RepID=UPI002DBFB0F2|nr:HNH endonuclease [Aeromonas caviae]MEB6640876.1 HNH endonuclease [Aeromonas caviae]
MSNNNNNWKLIPLENNTKYEINYDTQEIRNIKTQKILKAVVGKSNGYLKVSLYVGKRVQTIEVHRLVAKTFLQQPTDGKRYVVDHIVDGDKLNNHPSNLQYITQSENVRKSSRTKKYLKLTAEQKQEIQSMYQDGKSTIAITKHFNDMGIKVSRQTVSRIVKLK